MRGGPIEDEFADRMSVAIVALAFAPGRSGDVAASRRCKRRRANDSRSRHAGFHAVTAIGAVKPQIGAEVRVGARISGKLMRLPANIGDRVERGQVIAELESADLAATVARHEAAVAVAREKIGDAEARQKLSEATYQRQLSLLKISGTSRQLVDEALRETESAAVGIQIAYGARARRVPAARSAGQPVLCHDHGADLGRHRFGDHSGRRNGSPRD